jgi:rod shape-determining protein MreD
VIADGLKVGVLILLAAVLQAAVFAGIVVLGGSPDVLLVMLVAIALLRGSMVGAFAGFFGGLLLDIATLETLGMTSLLLTLAGYWTGRYGETSASGRRYSPYLAVAVMTVLYALGSLAVRFMLAEPAPARVVLVETLVQSLVLNLVLMWPVYAIVRRLLPRREPVSFAAEAGAHG